MSQHKIEAVLSAKDQGMTSVLSKIASSLESLDKTVRRIGDIMLKAQDKASPTIKKVNSEISKVDDKKAEVVVDAQNKATTKIHEAESALSEIDGRTVESVLEAENNVTKEANQASDSLDSIPEESFSVLSAENNVTSAANQATDSLDSIPAETHTALNADDQITPAAEKAGSALDALQQKAESVSSTMKNAFAFGAGSAIATKAMGGLSKGFSALTVDAVGVGKAFEASMSQVAATMGDKLQAGDFEKLEAAAQKAGATTQFSATQAADALQYMALAGWDANKSVDTLPAILNLAAAANMDLAKASDTVTDYLSAFSNSMDGAGKAALSASEMVDIMAFAQANSNTSADQLGEAWKNCAANLNAAGQDVQTVTSMLEAMANQGLKGSEAGTAMTAIMRDITAQMENGAIKIGKTSVAVQDAQGNFRDLTDIMKDVEKATEGMGDAQKAAALASTFTADSQKGVNLLLNEGMDKVEGYEKALRNCTGAAQKAADTMNDNLAGDVKNLSSVWEALQIAIYQKAEPALRSIVQTASSVVSDLKNIISGPQWSGVFNAISEAWENFVNGFKSTGALDAVKGAMDSIGRAIRRVAISLSGDARDNAESFGQAIGNIAKFVADAVKAIADFDVKTGGLLTKLALGVGAVKVFGGAFGKLGGLASKGMGLVKGVLSKALPNPFKKAPADAGIAMGQTHSKIAQAIESIGKMFDGVGKGIGNVFKGVGKGIESALSGVGKATNGIGKGLGTTLQGLGKGIESAFKGIGKAIESVEVGFGKMAQSIMVASAAANPVALLAFGAAVLMVGGAIALVATQAEGIATILQALGETIATVVAALGESIATVVTSIAAGVATIAESLTPIVEIIGNVFTQCVAIITNAIVQIVAAIAPFMPQIDSMVQSVAQGVVAICDSFNNLVAQVNPALENLRSIIETVFAGISDTLQSFGDLISDVFDGVSNTLTAFGDMVNNILSGVADVIESIGNAALNAGKGFDLLARGIERITNLNLFDMGASLAAVAGGITGISIAASGLGDAGAKLNSLVSALSAVAGSATAASAALMALGVSAVSLGGIATFSAKLSKLGYTRRCESIIWLIPAQTKKYSCFKRNFFPSWVESSG